MQHRLYNNFSLLIKEPWLTSVAAGTKMSCYYTSVKFGKHLKELRLHLCQTSVASKGVREFIESHYVPLKKGNPKFPILIRECSGVQPAVYARYEFGKESSLPLSGMSKEEVLNTIKTMANKTS